MGSRVGGLESGDPDFLAGAPGVVWRYWPLALWAFGRGRPRSLARDAARVVARIQPPPQIEGIHYIPPTEPFVLVGNHYQAPRVWVGWVAAAITDAVARARAGSGDELHWLVLAEFGRPRGDGDWIANPVTSAIFPRACRIWSLVPTPQRPADVGGRARALRQIMGYLGIGKGATGRPAEPIAIFPEGTGTIALAEAMPGTGAFLHRLSSAGVSLLPVGVHHEDKQVVIRFGCPFSLGQAPPTNGDLDTWAREQIMSEVGRLLPQHLWGVYAEAIRKKVGG